MLYKSAGGHQAGPGGRLAVTQAPGLCFGASPPACTNQNPRPTQDTAKLPEASILGLFTESPGPGGRAVSWAQKQDKGKLSARENHPPPHHPRSRVTLYVTVIKGAVHKPEKPNGPVCRCYLYHKATGAFISTVRRCWEHLPSLALKASSLDLVTAVLT